MMHVNFSQNHIRLDTNQVYFLFFTHNSKINLGTGESFCQTPCAMFPCAFPHVCCVFLLCASFPARLLGYDCQRHETEIENEILTWRSGTGGTNNFNDSSVPFKCPTRRAREDKTHLEAAFTNVISFLL